MAVGGEGPRLETFALQDMRTGWHAFASERQVQGGGGGQVNHITGPVFRVIKNLRWHDGVIEKRQSLRKFFEEDEGDPFTPIPIFYSEDPANVDHFPTWIYQVLFSPRDEPRYAFTFYISNMDIWRFDRINGWVNLTPVYTDGTISVGAGSTAVTGAGTLWISEGIRPFQHILVDGKYHQILTVNTNTSITLRSASTNGTTGFDAYEIRRNMTTANVFETHQFQQFARIFNGDLYVAGTSCGGDTQPAVIKVVDALTTSTPGVYLVANTQLQAGLDSLDTTGNQMQAINGMDVLQDGRVAIATEENVDRLSRLRYSSLLDQTQWTTTPGGFTDVVAGGHSYITAFERLGRVHVLHYHDTCVLAQPTGQDDPPFSFDSTRAEIGAVAARGIQTVGGRQLFIGHDMGIYAFNGSTTELVSDSWRKIALGADAPNITKFGTGVLRFLQDTLICSWIDTQRQEVQFMLPTQDGAPELACVNYRSGEHRREQMPTLLTAGGNNAFMSAPGADSGFTQPDSARGTRKRAVRIVAPLDATNSGDDTFEGLMALREGTGVDEPDYVTSDYNDGEIELITYPLDFGAPGVAKTIERVILFMRKTLADPNTETTDVIEVALSRNGGITTSPAEFQHSVTKTFTYDESNTVVQHYEFVVDDVDSAEAWAIRIRSTDNTRWVGGIIQILVRVQFLGEMETVLFDAGIP